jgi:antitoxin component of RelBE/YafQ-DinJ toxin-antitoxin module
MKVLHVSEEIHQKATELAKEIGVTHSKLIELLINYFKENSNKFPLKIRSTKNDTNK